MHDLQQENRRDETFDVLKGIAIFFVILGHCNARYLYPFIYSFHMPLFFFITGYFFKIRTLQAELRLSLKRLIIPYFFTTFLICVFAALIDLWNNSWTDLTFTQIRLTRGLLGYRGGYTPDWISGNIGLLWFILAMFWGRCTTLYLMKKIKSPTACGITLLILGFLGIFLGISAFVPYCIAQGLSAAGFIYTGCLIKKYNLLESTYIKRFIPFLLVLWLITWRNGGMSMARHFYSSGYIFDLLGSLGAFFTLFTIVKSFSTNKSILWRIFHFWGRYSLILFSVHSIEYDICNWRKIAQFCHISSEYFDLFQISVRIIVVYLFTVLILKIKLIREGIFQIGER